MAFFSTNFVFQLPLLTIIFGLFFKTDYVSSCYTSIFSFGDSLTDTGNFLYIDNTSNTGHFPYGETFFHHPTGRHSDGRVVVDFIAQAFGIPLLPPYLPHVDGQDLVKGANFAVGGATALDAAFFKERKVAGVMANVSLGDQIKWFQQLLPSLCNSPSGCRDFLRGSLFLVGEIGGNDYAVTAHNGRILEDIRTVVPRVINSILSAVHTLIEHGATTLVVPGGLPLGCFPSILTREASSKKEDYDTFGCLKGWNWLLQYHNHILKKGLDHMQDLHPDATIIYADYYNAAMRAVLSPLEFGFRKGALQACCGGGGPYNYNSSAVCGSRGAEVCKEPSLYFNWDGAHPTENGQKLIAYAVIKGPYAVPSVTGPCLSRSPHLKRHSAADKERLSALT